MILFVEGRRNGYDPEQCGQTMTVGDLISFLEMFPEEAKLYLKNDSGYTYGSITESSFEEVKEDFDGVEEDFCE